MIKESKYTMTLQEIYDDFGRDVFQGNDIILVNPAITAEFKERFKDVYWFHEIGHETIERFSHYLKSDMREKKGRFEALYKAWDREIEVFINNVSNRVQNASKQLSQDTTNESQATTGIHNIDTPNSATDVLIDSNLKYASAMMKSVIDSGGTIASEQSETGLTDETMSGLTVSEIEALTDYSNKFRDILSDFIKTFEDLFMRIY